MIGFRIDAVSKRSTKLINDEGKKVGGLASGRCPHIPVLLKSLSKQVKTHQWSQRVQWSKWSETHTCLFGFFKKCVFFIPKPLFPAMLHRSHVQAGHHPLQHAELVLLVLKDLAQLLSHGLAACGSVFEKKE